jgi:hypothetical protein
MKSNSSSELFSLLGLSLATSPFILTILAAHLLAKLMADIGGVSEELFRPDRLPVLNFPDLERHE